MERIQDILHWLIAQVFGNRVIGIETFETEDGWHYLATELKRKGSTIETLDSLETTENREGIGVLWKDTRYHLLYR